MGMWHVTTHWIFGACLWSMDRAIKVHHAVSLSCYYSRVMFDKSQYCYFDLILLFKVQNQLQLIIVLCADLHEVRYHCEIVVSLEGNIILFCYSQFTVDWNLYTTESVFYLFNQLIYFCIGPTSGIRFIL